ncbi:MAG: hypothetical protein IKK24_04870 [Clostridia bacterium]|nr:hypothetical protein [Clostridia bacterium]
MREVSITQTKNTVTISCEILGLDELLSLPWLSSQKLVINMPVFETVTFNFRNGHTFVALGGLNGERVVAKQDVTAYPDRLDGGAVCRTAAQNVKVARILKRAFMNKTQGELPFYNNELTLTSYVLMTRFIGYGYSFYEAIPFEGESYKVEKSFKSVAEKLHTKERALAYLESSKIPMKKSVRKIYFNKTGLLFYVAEGELLWDILKDPNVFCKMLNSGRIYEILSLLHQRPGISVFLYDYCNVMGASRLAHKMLREFGTIRRYAETYSVLSDSEKRKIQDQWRGKKCFYEEEVLYPDFSRPFITPDEKICDGEMIDGFRFCWLRTSRDYKKAGKELDNCLDEWGPDNNPVICVKKNGKAVAAIEVCGQIVIQARGYANSPLKIMDGLAQAYNEWKKKYNLSDQGFINRYQDDNDELPF